MRVHTQARARAHTHTHTHTQTHTERERENQKDRFRLEKQISTSGGIKMSRREQAKIRGVLSPGC